MKKIHFIGIAGKAIAPIAVMMKNLGWHVTGSDINVFEPMPTLLNKNHIDWFEGFDPERVVDADIVVIGGSMLMKDKNNPEFVKAKELHKKLVGYEYVLREFVVKEKSVVIAGTYGKTTTSSLLVWIAKVCGENPSFMTGGQPLNFDSGVESTDSSLSIFEGDEYSSVWGFDMNPRFIYYKPSHVLLTATQWDHVNIYPTEESYINAFKQLANVLKEKNGVLLYEEDGLNNKIIADYYNNKNTFIYNLVNVVPTENSANKYSGIITGYESDLTNFDIYLGNKILGSFSTTLIGDHNIENSIGAIAMSHILGLNMKKVKEAVLSFKGLKVHLETVATTKEGTIVISDLAHSPVKVQNTLEAVRKRFSKKNIIAIFDPHSSSLLERESLKWYPHVFDKADKVIIPRVIVKKSTPKEERVYGKDIVEAIKTTQPNAEYIPLDDEIVKRLNSLKDNNTVFLFMSGGGWREIINQMINER